MLPPRTSPERHALEDDLHFEWLHNGQIASFTFSGMSTNAIDTYFDTVIMLLKNPPEMQTLLLLIDLSKTAGITRYSKSRLDELRLAIEESPTHSRAAVVIPRSFATSIVLGLMQVFGRRLPKHSESRIFQARDKALEWLGEALDHL